MPYKRDLWHRLVEAEHQILRWVALVIIVLAVTFLAWFRWRPAPTRVVGANATPVVVSTHFGRIQSAYALQPLATRRAWLEQTLSARRAFSSSDEPAILAWLEAELAAIRAAEAEAASLAAGVAADSAEQRGDSSAALAARRDALRLQREANQLRPVNSPAALQREAAFTATIAQTEYTARHVEIEQVLSLAASAADPGEARAALAQARHLTRELGPTPAGLTDDLNPRLRELEIRLATRFTAPLHAESLALEGAATQASAAGDFATAAEHYARAAQTQQAVNDLHAAGEFADFPRLRRLVFLRLEAQAQPLLREIASVEQGLDGALRAADPAAALQRVSALSALLARLRTDYTDLTPRFDNLTRRLDFLSLHIPDLETVRRDVTRGSIPIPAPGGWRIQSAPIRQSTFARLTHDNPSRYADARLPVESVTADEARCFCERLAWLLACDVRLPLPGEISEGIAATGYSEWQHPSASNPNSTVFPLPSVSATPQPFEGPQFRSRHRTFRIVFSEAVQ